MVKLPRPEGPDWHLPRTKRCGKPSPAPTAISRLPSGAIPLASCLFGVCVWTEMPQASGPKM
eukprot:9632074-Alexandrium_andersonii.AAC.1